jgi:hypothetical protein
MHGPWPVEAVKVEFSRLIILTRLGALRRFIKRYGEDNDQAF